MRPQGATPAPAAEGAARGGRGAAGAAQADARRQGPTVDAISPPAISAVSATGASPSTTPASCLQCVASSGSANGLMTLASGEKMLNGGRRLRSAHGAQARTRRAPCDKARDKALRDNVLLAWTDAGTP
jgi:hypothetical protein